MVRDNARNAEARAAGVEGAPMPQEVEGVVYRLDDGSSIGRWRVCVEDSTVPPERRTWAVWDLRRGGDSPRQVKPIKVLGGIGTRERAILAASLLVQSRPARAVLAGWNAAAALVSLAVRVPEIVREEWRQP